LEDDEDDDDPDVDAIENAQPPSSLLFPTTPQPSARSFGFNRGNIALAEDRRRRIRLGAVVVVVVVVAIAAAAGSVDVAAAPSLSSADFVQTQQSPPAIIPVAWDSRESDVERVSGREEDSQLNGGIMKRYEGFWGEPNVRPCCHI
jgi:hypothetical protein